MFGQSDDEMMSGGNLDMDELLEREHDFLWEGGLRDDSLFNDGGITASGKFEEDMDPISLIGTENQTLSGVEYLDINNDEIPDTIVFDTNYDQIVDTVYSDTNGDTMIDRYIADENYDGTVDTDLIDKDNDFELEINN